MIPLRDHNPSGEFPWMTWTIIGINAAVFLYMMSLPDGAVDSFINTYSLIPANIAAGHHLVTLITSMFLHSSLGHIGGNMLFLKIFGDNMEKRLGRWKYLLFYLVCGLAASVAQIVVDPTSTIPQLGASGAIAGVMGGYLMLFPSNRIDVWFEIGPFLEDGTVPAHFMLVYWFLAQMFNGVGGLAISQDVGGVAYFAHIGGFVMGYILAFIFKKKESEDGDDGHRHRLLDVTERY